MNKMALGTSIGFAFGAFIGTVMGILANDFPLWLAVGTGCGIAIGTAIGAIQGRNKST